MLLTRHDPWVDAGIRSLRRWGKEGAWPRFRNWKSSPPPLILHTGTHTHVHKHKHTRKWREITLPSIKKFPTCWSWFLTICCCWDEEEKKRRGREGEIILVFFFFQNYVTVFTTAAARSAADSTAALIAPRATICALTFDMWSKGACVMWSQTHLLPAGNNTPPAEILYTVATERWHCVAAHPPLPFRRSYNATSWSVAFN